MYVEEKKISVYGYADNHPDCAKDNPKHKRRPLIQVLFSDTFDVHSMTFEPEHADKIITMIRSATNAVKRNKPYEHEYIFTEQS